MENESTDPLEGITPVTLWVRLDSTRLAYIIAVTLSGQVNSTYPTGQFSGTPSNQLSANKSGQHHEYSQALFKPSFVEKQAGTGWHRKSALRIQRTSPVAIYRPRFCGIAITREYRESG